MRKEYHSFLGYYRDIIFGDDKPMDTLDLCLLVFWIIILRDFDYVVISEKT